MGNSSSQRDARGLREILVGLDRVAQHHAAVRWAAANGRVIDMFGDFTKERHLLIFQSGNECENWIDPIGNVLYKMNTLTHVGEDLLKLLNRIDVYNSLFPETAMRLIGLQVMSESMVFPVFSQPFVVNARFATKDEIVDYMHARGFEPTGEDGKFSNGQLLLWDIKPKNVLITANQGVAVIDAEIEVL